MFNNVFYYPQYYYEAIQFKQKFQHGFSRRLNNIFKMNSFIFSYLINFLYKTLTDSFLRYIYLVFNKSFDLNKPIAVHRYSYYRLKSRYQNFFYGKRGTFPGLFLYKKNSIATTRNFFYKRRNKLNVFFKRKYFPIDFNYRRHIKRWIRVFKKYKYSRFNVSSILRIKHFFFQGLMHFFYLNKIVFTLPSLKIKYSNKKFSSSIKSLLKLNISMFSKRMLNYVLPRFLNNRERLFILNSFYINFKPFYIVKRPNSKFKRFFSNKQFLIPFYFSNNFKFFFSDLIFCWLIMSTKFKYYWKIQSKKIK